MRRFRGAAVIAALVVAQSLVLGPTVEPQVAEAACPPNYSAQWNSQSYSEVARRAGKRVQSWIWYKNVGCNTWAFQNRAKIGTWNPEPGQDQNSAIGGAGGSCVYTHWTTCNRVLMAQTSVTPGNLASFTFDVMAPVGGSGSYRVYMRPVIDGVTWMEDYGVWWQIDLASPINAGCAQGGRFVTTPDPAIQYISWTDCFTALYTIDNHQGNARKFGGQNQSGCFGTSSPYFSQIVSGSSTYHTPFANWGPYYSAGPADPPILCQHGHWGGADVWNQPIRSSAVTDSWRSVTIFIQWTCGVDCTPNYHSFQRDYYLP